MQRESLVFVLPLGYLGRCRHDLNVHQSRYSITLCDSLARLRTLESVAGTAGPGELLDKLTIPQIKLRRIADPDKLRNVRAELAVAEKTRWRKIPNTPEIATLVDELKSVN